MWSKRIYVLGCLENGIEIGIIGFMKTSLEKYLNALTISSRGLGLGLTTKWVITLTKVIRYCWKWYTLTLNIIFRPSRQFTKYIGMRKPSWTSWFVLFIYYRNQFMLKLSYLLVLSTFLGNGIWSSYECITD